MSLPEAVLWNELKGAKLGQSFRKQHPLGPYVADFYCSPAKLVIEVDGEAHDHVDRLVRDNARDDFIRSRGYRLLRIPAREILTNMDGVLRHIAAQIASPLHRASAVPLPAGGEDLK